MVVCINLGLGVRLGHFEAYKPTKVGPQGKLALGIADMAVWPYIQPFFLVSDAVPPQWGPNSENSGPRSTGVGVPELQLRAPFPAGAGCDTTDFQDIFSSQTSAVASQSSRS